MDIRVVLVEPSHPGNIGATARAMKTMGLKSLHLVNPSRFPDPQADWRAAGALDLVKNAVVHPTLKDAIADCGFVAATSARDRHIPWKVIDANSFAADVASMAGDSKPIAIVFGREDSGLTNEELAVSNVQVRIPSSPEYGSLNLAMSVQVVAYELFKAQSSTVVTSAWDRSRAKNSDVLAMYDHLDQVLNRIGFFDGDAPRTAFTRFQRMFARIQLDETEVQIVRGMLSHIERKLDEEPETVGEEQVNSDPKIS